MRVEDRSDGRTIIYPFNGRGIEEFGLVLDPAEEQLLRQLLNKRHMNQAFEAKQKL